VALLAAWRSRTVPPLRAAAVVLALWVAVDVAMTVATRFPAVFAARVVYAVTFAALPGVTAALFPFRRTWGWRLLPVALAFAYGAALVALRHAPLVAEHWLIALQASRFAVFAAAVGAFLTRRRRAALEDPGEGMGVLMAWGDGVSVAFGLWVPWSHGQAASAMCWAGVAVLVLLAGC